MQLLFYQVSPNAPFGPVENITHERIFFVGTAVSKIASRITSQLRAKMTVFNIDLLR